MTPQTNTKNFHRALITTLSILLVIATKPTYAVDRIDLSAGNISRPSCDTPLVNSFRLGVSWNTDYFASTKDNYRRSLNIETSVGLNETTYGDVRDILVAPVLRYSFNHTRDPLFFEASVGAVYISQTRWEIWHDMSSRLLFADRFGLGYSFDKVEISANFLHFSNAGIKPPNPGADMLIARLSFKL